MFSIALNAKLHFPNLFSHKLAQFICSQNGFALFERQNFISHKCFHIYWPNILFPAGVETNFKGKWVFRRNAEACLESYYLFAAVRKGFLKACYGKTGLFYYLILNLSP